MAKSNSITFRVDDETKQWILDTFGEPNDKGEIEANYSLVSRAAIWNLRLSKHPEVIVEDYQLTGIKRFKKKTKKQSR